MYADDTHLTYAGFSADTIQSRLNDDLVALMTLIDFTLSNARRFYLSMGNPSDMKGLMLAIGL